MVPIIMFCSRNFSHLGGPADLTGRTDAHGKGLPMPHHPLASSVSSSCASREDAASALDVHRRALRKHRKQVARIVADQWRAFAAPGIRASRHYRRKLLLASLLGFGRHVQRQGRVLREMLVLRSRLSWQRLRQALLAWRQVATEEITNRNLLRSMHSKAKQRRCAAALRAWRSFSLHQRSKRRRAIKAAYFRAFMLKSHALRAFHLYLSLSRSKVWKQAQAVYHRSHTLQRSALIAWTAHRTAQKVKRAHSLRAGQHAARSRLQGFLRAWHTCTVRQMRAREQWVQAMASVKQALAAEYACCALLAWHHTTCTLQRLRAAGVRATATTRLRVLASVTCMCAPPCCLRGT